MIVKILAKLPAVERSGEIIVKEPVDFKLNVDDNCVIFENEFINVPELKARG